MTGALWLGLAALLAVGFFLAAVEMATFSARKERMRQAARAGDARADLVLRFQHDPPRFLASTQILATLLAVLLGALGESVVKLPLQGWLTERGVGPAPQVAFGLTVAAITFVSLILGNLVPKHIGFVLAEDTALLGARTAALYIRIVSPLAWVVEATTRLVVRVLRIPPFTPSGVTEGDITDLLQEGLECGMIDETENAVVRRALALSDVRARDAMTPRDRLVWLDIDLTPREFHRRVLTARRSHLPVAEGDPDGTLGILKTVDYLAQCDLLGRDMHPAEVKAMLAPPVRVPPSSALQRVLEALRHGEARVALVTDEHGHVLGLLSLNDLVKALMGEVRSVGRS